MVDEGLPPHPGPFLRRLNCSVGEYVAELGRKTDGTGPPWSRVVMTARLLSNREIKFCFVYTTLILAFSHTQAILMDTVNKAGNGVSR